MFNRDDKNLNMLPIEALLVIFSYLSPEKLTAITLVNKNFSISTKDNLFWHMKFLRHFPHLYKALSTQHLVNWYAEFRNAYDNDYKLLPTATRGLFSLVKEGDIERIKQLQLKFNDLYTPENKTPLIHWAMENSTQELIDYFYEIILHQYSLSLTVDTAKTDPNGATILHWAICCHQDIDTIAAIISQGANINKAMNDGATPLYFAAQENRLEVVQYLLAHGANILNCNDGDNPINIAAHNGHLLMINYLLKISNLNDSSLKHRQAHILRVAAFKGHLNVVQYFLDQGVDINHDRIQVTPLYLAASKGHIEIVKYLLPNYKGDELIRVLVNLPKEYQANFLKSFGIEAFKPHIKKNEFLKMMIECFPENARASILEKFESDTLKFLFKGDKLQLIMILELFNPSDRSGILKIMGNDVLKSVINNTDDLLGILAYLPKEHSLEKCNSNIIFDLNGTLAASPHNLFAYRAKETSLSEETEEQPSHGPT